MVIGDDHLAAARLRRRHAGVRSDAVIHRDDQVRRRLQGLHQRRRQPVTMPHAMRHRETDLRRAQHAQSAHGERGAARAVAIEIRRDHDASMPRDGFGQQPDRGIDAAAMASGGSRPDRRVAAAAGFRTPRAAYTRRTTGCTSSSQPSGSPAGMRRTISSECENHAAMAGGCAGRGEAASGAVPFVLVGHHRRNRVTRDNSR